MHLTAHARSRAQQRSIPPAALKVLIEFGTEKRRGRASVLFMDKEARTLARRALGERAYLTIADKLDSYVVLGDDGHIVTAARRLKRLRF